jgi:hypothetical protein
VENAGGQDSFYAIDYAARTAADIVKVNFPDPGATQGVKAPYDRRYTTQQAVATVVASAGRVQVVFSGGAKSGGETVLSRTREAMDIGVIYGRNIWQREHDESLRFTAKITDILTRYPTSIETHDVTGEESAAGPRLRGCDAVSLDIAEPSRASSALGDPDLLVAVCGTPLLAGDLRMLLTHLHSIAALGIGKRGGELRGRDGELRYPG